MWFLSLSSNYIRDSITVLCTRRTSGIHSSFIMKHLVFLLLPFFTLSEVVDDFSKCSEFFLNNKPPEFTPAKGNTVKHICQCLWGDKNQQIYVYATLYSTTWKIPIYSAYVFGSPNIGRCDAWYIEPQVKKKLTSYNECKVKGEVCNFCDVKIHIPDTFADNCKYTIEAHCDNAGVCLNVLTIP